MTKKGFSTNAIHGNHKTNPYNALNTPICQTSTFVFNDLQHVEDVMSFKSNDYVYTRGNNPTLRELEEKIAILEGAKASVAFASGMAAISSTLLSFLKPGDCVVMHRTLYGSAYTFAKNILTRYGINVIFEDLTEISNLYKIENSHVKVIYFETPSNPNLDIIDISAVSEYAKTKNIKVVIDNTFATPYLQNPLKLGADVVVHSATKYICGHGDVVGGIAVSSDESYINELKFGYMCEFGGVMSPFDAWLLLRGLKTLSIRMERHSENGSKIADFLNRHNKVAKTYYPGLLDFKNHKIAESQMKLYGGIVSFELKEGMPSDFVAKLKLLKLAVSLGDCESLVQVPALMTHRGYDRSELEKFGFSENMIRISAGIEDVSDILEDIENALN